MVSGRVFTRRPAGKRSQAPRRRPTRGGRARHHPSGGASAAQRESRSLGTGCRRGRRWCSGSGRAGATCGSIELVTPATGTGGPPHDCILLPPPLPPPPTLTCRTARPAQTFALPGTTSWRQPWSRRWLRPADRRMPPPVVRQRAAAPRTSAGRPQQEGEEDGRRQKPQRAHPSDSPCPEAAATAARRKQGRGHRRPRCSPIRLCSRTLNAAHGESRHRRLACSRSMPTARAGAGAGAPRR